jgi:hypothetical protein
LNRGIDENVEEQEDILKNEIGQEAEWVPQVEQPGIPEPEIGQHPKWIPQVNQPPNSDQTTETADYDIPGKVYTVEPDGCEGENDASNFEASDFPTYKDDEVTGIPTIVRSKKRNGSMPTMEIEHLQGCSFLYEEEEDRSRHRAQIIKTYEDKVRDNSHHREMIKLRLRVQKEEFDKLVAYNDIISYIDDIHKSFLYCRYVCLQVGLFACRFNHLYARPIVFMPVKALSCP